MVELMKRVGVVRPTFTPEEMSDFISYPDHLNDFNEPGDAIAGRRLFSEKKLHQLPRGREHGGAKRSFSG